MSYETIGKPAASDFKVRPNLYDYEAQRASFSWDELARELDGLPGGGLNIAYEDVARLSNKWASVLRSLGVKKGDRVFVFLERIPELYAAVFGTLKAGAIVGPLFAAFGPDAVRDRPGEPGAAGFLAS